MFLKIYTKHDTDVELGEKWISKCLHSVLKEYVMEWIFNTSETEQIFKQVIIADNKQRNA